MKEVKNHCVCSFLKNKLLDIQLNLLEHVTYSFKTFRFLSKKLGYTAM